MGKKKASGKTYVSKGERPNVKRSTRNAMRQDYMKSGNRVLNQIEALKKGKDIVMTIDNPNREQTNMRRIKVRVSSKEWNAGKGGKGRGYTMRSTGAVEA